MFVDRLVLLLVSTVVTAPDSAGCFDLVLALEFRFGFRFGFDLDVDPGVDPDVDIDVDLHHFHLHDLLIQTDFCLLEYPGAFVVSVFVALYVLDVCVASVVSVPFVLFVLLFLCSCFYLVVLLNPLVLVSVFCFAYHLGVCFPFLVFFSVSLE